MERPLHALQNTFLQDFQETKTLDAILLANGIQLQGQVRFFDNYIVAMKSTTTQLIYKHANATIAPLDGGGVQPDQQKRNVDKPNVVVRTKPP